MNSRKLTVVLLAGLALALSVFGGCRHKVPSVYIFPRITGRVLDAQTLQPLADARVRWARSDDAVREMEGPKGAQHLDHGRMTRSDADGKFELASIQDVVLMRRIGWYAVSVSFEAPRYEKLIATYTITNAVRSPSGEPVVNAGDIKLVPVKK